MDQSSNRPFDENVRLMRKTADGDINAFKRLFQRFAPLMKQFFVIRGVDRNLANDLVQKIFTSLWHQRKKFHEGSSFETYLFSIARNTLNNEIRQSHKIDGKSSKRQIDSDGDTSNTLSQPENDFYLHELTDAIEVVKAKLTDEQFQALQASQTTDIDFQKVLKELGCSKEAYKSQLKRARERMREFLAPFFTDKKRRKKG